MHLTLDFKIVLETSVIGHLLNSCFLA